MSQTPSEQHPDAPSRRERRAHDRSRQRWVTWGAIALAAVIVIGLIIAVFTFAVKGSDDDAGMADPTRNPSPGLDGIIGLDIAMEDFEPGDCLADFNAEDDSHDTATVVECDQPHEAQLLGRKILSEQNAFPGEEALQNQVETFCAEIQTTGQTAAVVTKVTQRPSEKSWEDGDRVLDCYLQAQEGDLLSSSMIDEPVFETPGSKERDEEDDADEDK